MAGARPILCVDTCILIAWITGEKRSNEDVQGLKSLARQVDSGEVIMIASALYSTEILGSKTAPEALKMLDGLFKRSNVKSIPADIRVSQLAGQIRDYYQRQREIDGKPGLCTPDAIHLATAIHAKASTFLTFDRDGTRECRGLLPLTMNVAGYKLRIEPPRAKQTEMTI
jgi:predicted nucleic acid-binding protein